MADDGDQAYRVTRRTLRRRRAYLNSEYGNGMMDT